MNGTQNPDNAAVLAGSIVGIGVWIGLFLLGYYYGKSKCSVK